MPALGAALAASENGFYVGYAPGSLRSMVSLAGLAEDFPHLKERGRAYRLDALENPMHPVGDVSQHHDFESHHGQHGG